MELIIVLAIIAIIGAILAPNFLSATDKARLKSDIQSARVIQNAIELYNAEQSVPLSLSASIQTVIIPALIDKGYLSAASILDTQTASAFWAFDADSTVKVNISACTGKIQGEIYNALSTEEKAVIIP